MTLRSDAAEPSTGMQIDRLNDFLAFLAQRLSAPDYQEAESLLHAAINPTHARRRHEEASARQQTEAGEASKPFSWNALGAGWNEGNWPEKGSAG